jgi:nicotinamidase-related amidase
MAWMIGSLLDSITRQRALGRRIGIVVIDEQTEGAYAEAEAQRAVLDYARADGLPIWTVLLNPSLGRNNQQPTKQTNPLLGQFIDAQKIVKPSFNTWVGAQPDFEQIIKDSGVNTLVVMGRMTNQCVKMTAVGGYEKPNNDTTWQSGATQRGYMVMTSSAVVRGHVQQVPWGCEPGVLCYSDV